MNGFSVGEEDMAFSKNMSKSMASALEIAAFVARVLVLCSARQRS